VRCRSVPPSAPGHRRIARIRVRRVDHGRPDKTLAWLLGFLLSYLISAA